MKRQSFLTATTGALGAAVVALFKDFPQYVPVTVNSTGLFVEVNHTTG